LNGVARPKKTIAVNIAASTGTDTIRSTARMSSESIHPPK
jgi:hypothetical protein